jgi:putative membrane protein
LQPFLDAPDESDESLMSDALNVPTPKEGHAMLVHRAHDGELWKGMAAGLVGGLVASYVMNQFQTVYKKLAEKLNGNGRENGREKDQGADRPEQGEAHSQEGAAAARDGQARSQQAQPQEGQEGEDATIRTAEAIAHVFGRELPPQAKKVAGPMVHYAFGAVAGGAYGALAEVSPAVAAGAGLPFGAALWLTADELAVPALGLSKPVTEYPASVHAYALASHLVYGLTTDLVRRAVRRALD